MFFLTALLTAGSLYQGYRGQKQSSKAQDIQQRMSDQQASKERRQLIRQSRIKRAQILNQSAQSGTSGSSGEIGAVGGINSQLSSNLSESYATQALSRQQSSLFSSSSRSQMYSNVLGTAASFLSNPNNKGFLSDPFNKKPLVSGN